MDKLIEKIISKKNPTVVGLDPDLAYIPEHLKKGSGLSGAAETLLEFNKALIDAVYDLIPAVKPQSAYYEKYGWHGVKAFAETIEYAHKMGLYVIADCKRNDIGSTAEAYAAAYFGEAFNADALTVNGYLGIDGVAPFIKTGKDIYVLVKTSNSSSSDLQDIAIGEKKVYNIMGDLVKEWGKDSIGKYGYSTVGAVVGATYPAQLKEMREALPNTFFLVPGYGAQGGGAADILHGFDSNMNGAIINSSRAVMYAYQKEKCSAKDFAGAARREVIRMADEFRSLF